MEFAENLGSLKLQQSFIKDLNQQDIAFAEKQYQKIYAEQMSKLSAKIERIERVKRHLTQIESEETLKQKQMKQSLSKRYKFNEKNKEKYMTEKIKSYKLHHQLWENKLQTMKKKHKDDLKINADQSKKYKQEVERFWKTKTQQISSLQASRKKQYQIRYPSFNHKNKKVEDLKLRTQSINYIIPEIKRENTRNSYKNLQGDVRNKDHSQTKTIRFLTENLQQHNVHQVIGRKKNDSHITNKYSIHSTRDRNVSKHSLEVPHLDQNKFSENLYNNHPHELSNAKTHNQFPNVQTFNDLKNRKNTDDQKINFSFQKAMKKLDKIHKLKEKNIKKLKQKQQILSPCKPRKAIDDDQYRLLRAKSEAKKGSKKLQIDQNTENNEYERKQSKITSKNIPVINLSREQKHNIQKNIQQSRLSVSQTIKRQQQIQVKEIDCLQQSRINKWKKDKIVKAIQDKIFKIKLQQMQKIKQNPTF